jgi:hypothetical protein
MPLTADRNTPRRDGVQYEDPVAAGQTIYRGALVCLNASGELVKGAVATTLKARGVAETSTLDANYTGTVRSRRGVHRFRNSAAGDAIAAADIGTNCFIVDDETVAKTNGSSTRSVAGVVRAVDAQGVWVEI